MKPGEGPDSFESTILKIAVFGHFAGRVALNCLALQVPLTVSVPTTVFAKIYVDIMFMPTARGFRYIVAAKDDLSGVTEAHALRRATAQSLAKFFWEKIYCRYGVVLEVTTDNGSELKEAFALLMATLGVPHVKISP